MFPAILRDARYAFRTLGKTPGVTSIAVLALALGIGANAAIFTLVKAILLSPLPYPEPDRIALLMRKYRDNPVPTISVLKLDYWRRNAQTLDGITGFDFMGSGFNLVRPGGEAERVLGLRVAGDFFKVIGVAPAIGRGITAEETRAGGPGVVVISHGLWQRTFGGDPGVVGRNIPLSGQTYQVVGVMPQSFRFAPEAELWVPLHAPVKPDDQGNFLLCLARLKAGVSLEQARVEMERIAREMRREYGKVVAEDESVAVAAAGEALASVIRPALLMLLGAVAFVLLIACANIANLLLARAASRTKEVALRVAMGAGRWDLARQMLVESTVLALAGGAAGLFVGWGAMRALVAAIPVRIPIFDYGLDLRVVLFTVAVSLCTGLLFGLAPAIHAWRTDLNTALKDSARAGESRGRGLFRRSLVVAEVALAVVLVAGAGLLMRSIVNLQQVRAGFDPQNVITMQMSMTGPRYADPAAIEAFYRRGIDRIRTIPGVHSVATVTSVPAERGPDFPFEIPGRTDTGDMPSAQWRAVTADYFETLRIPLQSGRTFSDTDTQNSTPVILVNEAFARRCWPGRNPIGERLILGRIVGFNDPARVIVGVVADVKEAGVDTAAPPVMYVPNAQVPPEIHLAVNRILPVNWVVRTNGAPGPLVDAIKRELRTVDPQQPVSNVRTMEEVIAQSLTLRSLSTTMLSIFAGLALLLAAIGVYGVMAYSVAQRTHEIGVRMALGAAKTGILRMVLGQAGLLAGLGVVIGLAAAAVLTRMLATLLFEVSATNPLIFAAVGAVLVGVALIASYIPARRAMRVDPTVALRYE